MNMNFSLTVVAVFLCGCVCAQTNTFPTSGSVGIGTTTPEYKLDVYGATNSWKGRFGGEDGYILIGPANPYWAHLYTDRPGFLFNQPVYAYEGGFSSYNTADLSLQTNGTTRLTVANATGNVGIGMTSPGAKLDVNGNVRFYPSADAGTSGALKLQIIAGISQTILQANSDFVWANHDIVINGANSTTGNTNQLVVHRTGNVGIGTASPNEKLTVNGTIYGKEVKVDLSVPGPDYVFEQDYYLPSIEELERYILLNKHLPDVPSAQQMDREGINVGEMNMLLLRKIEELTLYVIELKNENEQIKSQLKGK